MGGKFRDDGQWLPFLAGKCAGVEVSEERPHGRAVALPAHTPNPVKTEQTEGEQIMSKMKVAFVIFLWLAGAASESVFAQTRDIPPPRDTSAPPRDTAPARSQGLSLSGDKIAAEPLADLYPVSGGFAADDGTSWVLVVGNKGTIASSPTHVRFHLKIDGKDNNLKGEIPLPEIAVGADYELRVTSLLLPGMIKTLYARIDQPAVVAERDEKNNVFSFVPGETEVADTGSGMATGKRQHRSLKSLPIDDD